jgi:hypothetical protein
MPLNSADLVFWHKAKSPAYPIGYDVGGDHPVQRTGNYLGLN